MLTNSATRHTSSHYQISSNKVSFQWRHQPNFRFARFEMHETFLLMFTELPDAKNIIGANRYSFGQSAASGYTGILFVRQQCYIWRVTVCFSSQKVVLRICVSGSENSAALWQPIDCVHSPQSKLIFCQFLTPSIAAQFVNYDSSVCI